MNPFSNVENFNDNYQINGLETSDSESKEELELEISNLKNEYQLLLEKNEELDLSLDTIKEKYLLESKRLKWHIKTNEEALQSLQLSSQSAFSNSPIDETKLLQIEIDQLNDDVTKLKENEHNLSFSNSKLNQEIDEIEFLIESLPFNHEHLFKLAQQKINHQLNKEVINYQILTSEAESKKQSLQVELSIVQSIFSKWKSENEMFSQKIELLQEKRKKIAQKMKEVKQNESMNFHTIQLSKLQKKLDQKNEEKANELNYLNLEYEPKFKKIENQLSMTKFEIDERLNAIEELNKKHIELTTEYEKSKENANKKIMQIKQQQSKEIADIIQRFQIEKEKALSNQKKSA
ncbi:hypothetical protein M9Y10_011703 [Tritrichomonas musculus]|uniref:Uncharacterized protein n=1 Tax=Tritrichomonas musculus TaxID=1915356 RepID=A0ABR2IL69_9EUKA